MLRRPTFFAVCKVAYFRGRDPAYSRVFVVACCFKDLGAGGDSTPSWCCSAEGMAARRSCGWGGTASNWRGAAVMLLQSQPTPRR